MTVPFWHWAASQLLIHPLKGDIAVFFHSPCHVVQMFHKSLWTLNSFISQIFAPFREKSGLFGYLFPIKKQCWWVLIFFKCFNSFLTKSCLRVSIVLPRIDGQVELLRPSHCCFEYWAIFAHQSPVTCPIFQVLFKMSISGPEASSVSSF